MPSRGTTFRVELPAAGSLAAAPEDVAPRPSSAPAASTSEARILVVDDEPKLARTLELGLGDRFEMVVCTRGEEALERLLSDPPYDLILCDLMMPEMSGMELFERVTAQRPELATRFVFMTGGAFTARARAFLHEHRARRLEKPFTLEAVERLIEEERHDLGR